MAKNKVLFGLSNVHVAFLDETEKTYGKPTHIPGAVNLALSPEGEDYKFYADNILYYAMNSNNGYTGDLEMALIPDEFLIEALGWEKDENGLVVEIADGAQKPFALLYEVKGDKKNRRFAFYNCITAKPSQENSTETESRDVNTQTLTITVSPKMMDGRNVVKSAVELDEANAAVYNGFFDSVVEPFKTVVPGV